MELIVIIVLAVFGMGIAGFFLALGSRDRAAKLSRRMETLESDIARLSRALDDLRRSSVAVRTETREAERKPQPATPAGPDADLKAPFAPKVTSPILLDLSPAAPPVMNAAASDVPKQGLPTETTTPATGNVGTKNVALDQPEAAPVLGGEQSPPPMESVPEAEDISRNLPVPESIQEDIATTSPVAALVESPVDDMEKTDWEARIGKRWLTWGGVLLLVAAAGFLIKYAYDQGWIGPWTQIAIGIVVGCGLCALGDWQVRVRNMRPLGQGVMGLGLTLVYLTCFGAYAYFRLEEVSQITALALLAATSGSGILLSNRHRSMPICILAAIGGYLAPILVSTGLPPPIDGLFAYTVLVNLGVIGVSMLRTWPALPLLAFGGTIVHFWGWYAKFYQPGQSAKVGMWAAIFHFVFLALPSLPLLRGHRQTPWQWLLPVANAVLGVYVTWTHLRADHPLALMLVLIGMAAAHIGIGVKVRTMDGSAIFRGLYSILGLAVLTLAPLAWFGMQANLICWLALGLVLIELGCRVDFKPYRGFGYANLLLGLLWCVARLWTDCGWQSNAAQFAEFGLGKVELFLIEHRFGDRETFLASLFDLRYFWTRLLVPVAWGGSALILHRWRERDARRFLLPKIVGGVGALLIALIFIGNDINPWIQLTTAVKDTRFALGYVLGPLWCLGAAATALAGKRWRTPAVSWLSLVFLAPAAVLVSRLFFHEWLPSEGFFLNAAYFAKVFFSLCCVLAAWVLGGPKRMLSAGIAGYLIILTQHSELYSWMGGDAYWVWSLTWNAGALAYLAAGWKSGNRDLAVCFWLPFAVAAFFAQWAMLDSVRMGGPAAPFANMNYLSASLIAVSLFLKSIVSDKNRLWFAIVAGWIALAVNQVELYGWFLRHTDFGQDANIYRFHWSSALLCNAGALTYAVLHWRSKLRDLRTGAALPAIAAAAHLVNAFILRPGLDALPSPFANMFYVNEILLAAAVLVAALESRELRVWLGILGGYILLVATHLEIGYWQGPWMHFAGRFSRTAWYTALWAVGAVAYLAAAIRYRRKRIFFAALRVLSVALFCAAWQYLQEHRWAYTLFLNARFLTSFLALAVLVAMCRIASLYERGTKEEGFINIAAMYRRYMYIFAAVAGFLLLSLESYSWCLQEWGDDRNGRRVAVMSLSIAWGVYSIFLLITGFATRIRGWRLSGLILFGVTCLKLVIVDLARIGQLHRILSFMAVGLLLMAASYLYHKLEKRLKDRGP